KMHVLAINTAMLANPAPGLAQHAKRVGFIYKQQRLVLALDFDDALERRHVSIHAIDALHGDQHPPRAASNLSENLVQGLSIVMWKWAALGPRQANAAENRIVRQAV